MTNFIEEQQREAHMAGLAKSKNAKDCGDLTVLPLGYVSGITKQTITNTLNHILESGLLEELDAGEAPSDNAVGSEQRTFGSNRTKRAIKAHLDELIKSTK